MHSLIFFNDPATTEIYTLSLHDALPICTITRTISVSAAPQARPCAASNGCWALPKIWMERAVFVRSNRLRSEEHTSELQSRQYLVCRLLLEKKKQSPIFVKENTCKYYSN